MATRDDLLDAFETKLVDEGSFLLPAPGENAMPDGRSYIREIYDSLDGQHTVRWEIATYWDNVADNVEKASFYVQDPGAVDEDATWFKGQDPKSPAPEPTFRQEMEAWLDTKIEDGTILFYNVVGVLPAKERGVAEVRMDNETGDLVSREVGIWRAADGMWNYRVVTG